MDLQWQIQHSEKNWNREKRELLERLDRDRREWEWQKKELLRRLEQVSHCVIQTVHVLVTLPPRKFMVFFFLYTQHELGFVYHCFLKQIIREIQTVILIVVVYMKFV